MASKHKLWDPPWRTTCFLNYQGQKTKTPWLFLVVGFELCNNGGPAYWIFKKHRQSPRGCFHGGGSALNLIIHISVHGIIVSIVDSHCKQKSYPPWRKWFHMGYISMLFVTWIFKAKRQRPRGCSWWLAFSFVRMVSQPIEYSRSKDKAPAVVLTGGVQPWSWSL